MLRIESIQTALFSIIVQHVLVLKLAENPNDNIKSMLISVFNHVRWCESIFEPNSLIECIINAIPLLPEYFQIEAISTLPSIAVDSQDTALVERLLDFIDSFPGRTLIIALLLSLYLL